MPFLIAPNLVTCGVVPGPWLTATLGFSVPQPRLAEYHSSITSCPTVLDRYFRRQPSHRLEHFELPLSFRRTCLSANSRIAVTRSDSHAPVILSAYWPDNSPRVSTPQVCYAFYITAVGLVPGSWPLARFWDHGAGMAWHVSTAGQPGTGRPHRDTCTTALADSPDDALIWDQVRNTVTESTPPPRPIAFSLQQ